MGVGQMYKDHSQLRIEDFVFPYGKLDPENDWGKLAALVPWDVAEERYAARFVNNGVLPGARDPPVRPCLRQAAKGAKYFPPAEETGVSGQL